MISGMPSPELGQVTGHPARGRGAVALVLVMLAAGLGLRLLGLATPPVAFHPIRQYSALAVARSIYLEDRTDVPAWRRDAAVANRRNAPNLEPRIVEWVAAQGYRLVGGERMWMGGLVSSVSWIAAGWILFTLGRRLGSPAGGAVAVAVHLFLPYAIVASRSFQADPTMVAFLVAGVRAMVRHHDEPTAFSLGVVTVVTAAATILKPVSVLFLVVVFAALALVRRVRQAQAWPVLLRHAGAFSVLGLAPGLAFYAVTVLTRPEMEAQSQLAFVPRLLATPAFWHGWFETVNVTAFVPLVALAVVGAVGWGRRLEGRVVVGSLFAGYALYGLIFDYHVSTHDYYSLPLIPVVGLGVGVAADAAVARIRRIGMPRLAGVGLGAAVLLLVVAVMDDDLDVARPDPVPRSMLDDAWRIGETVSHSTKTVLLAEAEGRHLTYHGEFAGSIWPTKDDLDLAATKGWRTRSTEEQLEEQVRQGAEWFVVADMRELQRQPRLLPLLETRGRLVTETERFVVFDLRP